MVIFWSKPDARVRSRYCRKAYRLVPSLVGKALAMRTEDLPVSGTVRSRVGLRASGARAESLNARPSEFVALARLLRELDDVAALRSSPLLREAFAKPDGSAYADPEGMALLRARAAVLSAIASLDSGPSGRNIHFARQRAIVTRCDLRGEKHAKVANDLGVSLREFYRERRRAFERLLVSIPSNLAVRERSAPSLPTRFELIWTTLRTSASSAISELPLRSSNESRTRPAVPRMASARSATVLRLRLTLAMTSEPDDSSSVPSSARPRSRAIARLPPWIWMCRWLPPTSAGRPPI